MSTIEETQNLQDGSILSEQPIEEEMIDYVSLHNITHYSLMNSKIKPIELLKRAKELNMKAVAITDFNSFAGIYEAYKFAKSAKIKLIVGCQYNFVDNIAPFVGFNDGSISEKPTEKIKNLVLLATNQVGYSNILKLNRVAFNCRFNKLPLITWDNLQEFKDGVVCLTGDACGILGYEICNDEVNGYNKALENAIRLQNIFDKNLYIEFVPNNLQYNDCSQFMVNRQLFKLSNELGIKPVAASNSRYLSKDKFKFHDMLLAIKNGRGYKEKFRPRFELDQLYLHNGNEIVNFFKRNFGKEFALQLCANSIEIANMCENPDWTSPQAITKRKFLLPDFPVHDEPCYNEFCNWKNNHPDIVEKAKTEPNLYMRYFCENRFNILPQDKLEEYKKRYTAELEVYENLGFSSYMLITSDFLNWGRKNGVKIGPGRGSVGGSLVGHLLNIHQADSIKYGLIFERFLNAERLSLPDVDNDVDSVGRERVINYVTKKYGKDCVANVSNYMLFTPKVAITDVITALEIGGSRADAFKIAKNITETIDGNAKTIKEAISSSKLLETFLEEHPDVLEFAEEICGLIRSASTHAAGIVISSNSLPGLVPLRVDESGKVCLEWEKEKTEENGLVKIDFLGLETLNIINKTNEIIESLGGNVSTEIDYDAKYTEIYENIKNGNTMCVFQLGASGGTIGLCNMTEPTTLEDLAVINALARPGVPTEIKKSFIDRKFGREEWEIPHPNLTRAVKDTYGYCIFEESFLFLAHDFCGWNLQKADKMRKISKLKAKGKQILAELETDFIESAVNYSKVSKEFAQQIWDDWVIPLSGYAFNKSHSILYSMTSLHTAYLKTYYPVEFLTANLISETNSNAPNAKDNILKLRYTLRKMGIEIKAPDINEAESQYKLVSKNKLLMGMSALHGVKAPAALDIMAKRPFDDYEDFLLKTDSSLVRSTVVGALAACGSLDSFKLPRKTMFLHCSDLRKKLKVWKQKNPDTKLQYKMSMDEWKIGEIRALEAHYLGEAISGNKSNSFERLFSGHKAISVINELEEFEDGTIVVIEAEVVDMFTFRVKKAESKIFGKECCKMLLEDINGDQIGIIFFPEALKKLTNMYNSILSDRKFEKGFGIRVSGKVSRYNNELSLVGDDVYGLFAPTTMPNNLEQLPIELANTRKKKVKDVTNIDIENDLLTIIGGNDGGLKNIKDTNELLLTESEEALLQTEDEFEFR